jgi:peptide/nickel transport system substrate-binding protein
MREGRKTLNSMLTLLVVVGTLAGIVAGCAPAASPTAEAPAASPTSAPAVNPTSAPAATATAVPATPTVAAPPEGGELIVGLSWEPSKIDPHRTAAENGILPIMQTCETLVMREPDGTLVPGLASSWDISDDGKDYTFHLREGINFHDGTPFNAEAVKYNFDRIKDPATMSEYAVDYLGSYTGTDVVDDYTAVVHTDSPVASFLGGLAEGWMCMVSPTAAEKWGPEEFQDHFVGTGPFIFKEWKRGEYIRVEKNPDYWGGPEFFDHQGLAYLDAIVFKFVEEATVRTGTLETGEIHIAQEVQATDVAALEQDPNINVLIMPSPGTGIFLMFNMSKAPTDDLKVRQAINYAIDQKAISDTLYQGVLGPSYGPLTPPTPCYWSGAEQMYPYDPEKAKELLDEAGWTDTDGDGIRDKDGQPLRLDFPTHGGFPVYRDPAPIVQAQLAEVGIDVNVQDLAAPAWMEAGRTGNLNIGIVDWRAADPDFDLRQCFDSANSGAFAWNWHHNAHLDQLLEEGMVTLDTAKRCTIYEEVQKIIMDDAMIKPINLYSAVYGVRNNVKGLKIDTLTPSWFWVFDTYLEQ